MSEQLYPSSTVSMTASTTIQWIGSPQLHTALDADRASYVNGSGVGSFVCDLPNPTMTTAQMASVSLEFDARPMAAFVLNTLDSLVGELRDARNGTVYCRTVWTPDGSTSFKAATIEWGSTVTATIANNLRLYVFMPGGVFSERWEINDARMVVTQLFNGATATPTGPTGAINDNTPTLTASGTVEDPTTETIIYYRWRIYNAAQYGIGGFDPAESPATWDSGFRTGSTVVAPPLPAGTYRAYVAAIQQVYPGPPWFGRPNAVAEDKFPLMGGAYAFTSFSVIPAAPAVAPPAADVDVVRDLTDDQRALLSEAFVPVPRATLYTADGVFVRELTIITPSASKVVLDSRQQIRGSLDLTVSDLDLAPASRSEISGENKPLHPYGSYIHASYGIQFGRYDTVRVSLGLFRITSVKRDSTAGKVTVKAKTFELNVQESRIAYPVTRQNWDTTPPTPFTVVATAALVIAEAGIASKTPTASSTQVVQNYAQKIGDDRLKVLDDLANAMSGWVWYADIDGVIYFGTGPDITADAITYTFESADPSIGRLTATVVDREQELSRDDVYDVVVAYDDAIQFVGGAFDSNPDSVIQRSAATPAALEIGAGQFSPGGKPFFYSSPTIASLSNAQAVARTRMRAVALPAEAITATCVPIPDLRPDKMVSMARDGASTLVKWQLVKVSCPMTVGPLMELEALTLPDDVVPAS